MTLTTGRCTFAAVLAAFVALVAPALAQDASAGLDRVRKGVVTVCAAGGEFRRPGAVPFFEEDAQQSAILGSGIIISADGVILTANHAIDGIANLSVVLWDLTELKAALIAAEPGLDIALLRVQHDSLSVIPWRTDVPPSVGEFVFAIGTPGVFPNNLTASVSRGIVSALHRSLDVTGDPEAQFMSDLIETDAQLSPGESGGALVDEQGRLIGMCLAVYHPTGAIRGRAFALASDGWLRNGIDSMLSGQPFPLGSLGLHVGTISPDTARRLGLSSEYRVRIGQVDSQGSATTVGLRRDDIVTHINGERLRLTSDYRRIEMRLVPGTTAKLTVLTGKPLQSAEVEVAVAGAAPGQSLKPEEFRWRGLRLRDVDDKLRRDMGIPNKTGVAVIGVGGRAEIAGLRVGNVISEVNNTRVGSLADFKAAVKDIPDSNMVRVKTSDGIGHIEGEMSTK
jgi:serine protease Do